MTQSTVSSQAAPFVDLMAASGMPEIAIDAFRLHLDRYLSGETGVLDRRKIEPVADLPEATAVDADPDVVDDALRRVAVVKLNGGLGTSMGLERAKSLIEVRPGATFIDLIARQILTLRQRTDSSIPLLLMNSFRTRTDTEIALARHPGLAIEGLPLGFLQHKVPKVAVEERGPAVWPDDPELVWCPPGHGDVYTALETSGVLARLLEAGYEHAFISNSDNLGAVLDPQLLGFLAESNADFMMEVADRTPADRKGGHLCRLRDGRLALRESAQCPADEQDEFQDIRRYRFFNTNNIWVSLPALAALLERHNGALPLDTIVNHKTLDPRDPSSPPVVQLETAMGAAISLFENAVAVRVPRRRFSPVKNTNDLLGVRSDAFEITDDGRVVLARGRDAPPVIDLDPGHYRLLDDFEGRFPEGPPSLARCSSLTVRGDVTFGAGVIVDGTALVRGTDEPCRVPDSTTLSGDVRLRS